MKKPINYVKHLGNNRYKVMTPNPYIVELNFDTLNPKGLPNNIHSLNEHCKFLYNTLRVLGISKQRAKERDYTLNIYTGDAFSKLLINRDDVSHEFKMMIVEHDW